MTNFSNLFPTYISDTQYISVRDALLQSDENSALARGVNGAGAYGYNNAAYTIGFGYDIRYQTGSQIISDFTAAGIFTPSNTNNNSANGPIGQYVSLVSLLSASANVQILSSSSLPQINAVFVTDFGNTGITQPQAASLLDAVIPRYDASLTQFVNINNAQQDGFTLGDTGLHLFLLSEWYNGGQNVFGLTQSADVASDNVTDFLADVLFYSNTTVGVFSAGLENRRIQDLSTAVGLPSPTVLSGTNLVTLNYNNNFYAALYVAQSIVNFATDISTQIASLGASAASLSKLESNLLQNAENALILQGVYIVQTNDTWSSIAATVNSITNSNAQSSPGFTVTGDILQQINSAFSDSSDFAVGELAHVPTSVLAIGGSPTPLAALNGNYTYVFDPSSGNLYTVGSSLDGSNAGQFVIDTNGVSLPANLVTDIYAGTNTLTLDLADGTGATTSITINTSSPADIFGSGAGYNSDLTLNPVGGSLSEISYIGSGLKFNLSQNLNGLPVSVLSVPTGAYSLGLDPPGTFESVASFSTDGLNGDTVSVSDNGTAVLFQIDIGVGATAELAQDYALAGVSDEYNFTSIVGTLKLDDPSSFLGTISNFQAGDTIDLVGVAATSAALGADNLLTVQQSEGDSIALQLAPTDNFSGTSFNYSSDGNGGTDITESTWSVAPTDPIVNEDAGQEVFAISRAGDISQAATVYVSTTDGSTVAGEDVNDGQFDAFSNHAVVFAAGQATATVPVTINDQQDSSGQEYNFGLQVSDGPSASANTIVSNPFSILDDDVPPIGTYSSVTYSYLGGPLYGTTDDDATYDNLGEFEGDVEGTVVFNNLPFDFSGPFTPTDWTVSALGVTSENTFPQDPRISEQAWGLDVQNGQIQLWSMEFFWASDSPTGNYLYVESSSRGDQASLGNYASASDIAGTWTIDSATLSSDVDLSPAAGQTQSLSDALRALRLNNQSAQNLTISGAGTIALNGTIENVPKVEVAGNLHLQNGALETDPITIDAGGIIFGYGTISGSQTVDGTVTATGGTLDIAGDVSGTGTLIIDGSSALLLEGTVAATESLSFTGSGASLIIGTSSSVLPTIAGFSSGDVIGIDGDSVTAALYSTMTDELTLTASSGAEFTLNFSGSNQPSDFVVSDGEVVDYALCFLEGTRILTPRGEIPIEEMQIGDLVMTGAGDTKPIKWIGRRAYDGRFIAGNHLALPVCIKQNAIAGRVPSRDLNVSPGHGIFVGGVLVPAWRLVNGVSITQAESVQGVSYINVELESHEVILANNCPAETFLNIGNFREQFQNADEFKELYPDDDAEQKAFIPRLEEGFKLHAIQSYLAGRAGTAMPAESQDDMVRGFVDEAGPRRVCGWVQCVDKPEAPVRVDIWVGGRLVARALANGYRADLRQAGLGSGCHGFDIPLPIGLSGPVRVRRVANQTEIVLTVAAEARAA